MPRNVFDLSFISALPYYYLFLTVLGDHARHHLVDDQQPDGILPARHQGFRARGALARRAGEPHQALRLHAERRPDQRRRRALCDDVRLRRSGIRARHPDLGEDADHGGARRRRPAVRPAGRRRDPGAAGGNLQQPARRQGRRPHLRRLWRHHRADRALPARRHPDPDQAAVGAARQGRRRRRSRREQAMLLEARDVTKAFGSFKAVDARLGDAGAGRYSRPDRAERRRQIDLLQLPDRRSRCRPPARCCSKATTSPAAAGGARAARPRAHLPGAADLREHDGAGERHDRRVPAHLASRRGRGQARAPCWSASA